MSVENINFGGNMEAREREGSDNLCVSSVIRDVSSAGLKEKVLERDFIEITAHL